MRILAFAYACEPDKGSEPGAGWHWARMLARLGEAWVITRANNRIAIEARLHELPEASRLHFVYVDLPRWARWWKRGQRGVRLYYLIWQFAALRVAWRLHRERQFDVVWHLTFANAWLGTTAGFVGPPLILGPVGAGAVLPFRLFHLLGWRGAAFESLHSIGRSSSRALNPLARLSWRKASLILAQNQDTREWLPQRHREKIKVFPNAIAPDDLDFQPERSSPRTALFAGRLLPWKGVALAIRAVARTADWQLLICGSGPDERRLRRLARKLGVESRVIFHGWVSRPNLHRLMHQAEVFVFPSLHDEAGWAVAEAIACGLPVLCLSLGGPPGVAGPAGIGVPVDGGSKGIVIALASHLSSLRVPEEIIAAQASKLSFAVKATELRALTAGIVAEAKFSELGER